MSTVHKKGWDEYGEAWLRGIKYWPANTEFVLYTEGFDLDDPRVTCRRIEQVERCEAFKKKVEHYRPVSWRFDVVRFCNKTYAACDALEHWTGLGVWLDADCETYAPLPEDYIRGRMPIGHYLARFERTGDPTETGFWVMDCSHPDHRSFLETWRQWYEEGAYKQLTQWCDAATMDATVRQFRKQGRIQTVTLSGDYSNDNHPMAKTDIGRFIDHKKGDRKGLPKSLENAFREARPA